MPEDMLRAGLDALGRAIASVARPEQDVAQPFRAAKSQG
jgi:hypothetical protein